MHMPSVVCIIIIIIEEQQCTSLAFCCITKRGKVRMWLVRINLFNIYELSLLIPIVCYFHLPLRRLFAKYPGVQSHYVYKRLLVYPSTIMKLLVAFYWHRLLYFDFEMYTISLLAARKIQLAQCIAIKIKMSTVNS